MLTFRNTNIVFALLLVVLIVIHVYSGLPYFVYALLVVGWSLVVFYGCYYINSQFFLPVICEAATQKKQIAISFDDGPVKEYTPAMLELLKENNVEAAFFCIGNRVEQEPQILKQVIDEGHIIGNHSFSHHFWFDLFSSKQMLADMQSMDAAASKAIGMQPKLFRPPYGVINPNLKKAIQRGNYITVGWNVRSLDTVIKDENKLLQKVVNALKPGAIYLFHDTSKATLAILPAFIKQAKANGYEIVRLDKLINVKAYA